MKSNRTLKEAVIVAFVVAITAFILRRMFRLESIADTSEIIQFLVNSFAYFLVIVTTLKLIDYFKKNENS